MMRTRFFCESCGTEVRSNAKRCPGCGRLFTSVRCPRCSFEGTARQFVRGCPTCGYAPASAPLAARRPSAPGGRSYQLPRIALPATFYRVATVVLAFLLLVSVVLLVLVSRSR